MNALWADQDSLDQLATTLLTSEWGVRAVPRRIDVGVNKRTWRAGDYWLSCAPERFWELIRRESSLYEALAAAEGGAVAIPAVVPARSGLQLTRGGAVWRLTRNVPGRRPHPAVPGDAAAVVAGVARLHCWLQEQPVALAVSQSSTADLFTRGVRVARDPSLGFDRADLTTIERGREVVLSHDVHAACDRRLVHGDPSFPNLRLSTESPLMLIGAVDWDCCRVDDVLTDLAVLGHSVVFRSRAENPLRELRHMIDTYQNHGGRSCSMREVLVYMVMAKFESIAHHGERFFRREAPPELVASQPAEMRAVLELYDRVSAHGG